MVEGAPGGRVTIVAETLATLSDEGWRALSDRVGALPPALRLADADIFTLTLPMADMRATRAAVARALPGRTPVAIDRLCWGHAAGGDGSMRVAMAHRARVAALIALLNDHRIAAGPILAGDVVLVVDEDAAAVPATRASPLWLLAAIPLLTGIGAWVLAGAGAARIARLTPIAEGRAADDAARAGAAAVFARPTIGDLLTRLEAVLPPGATLHALETGTDGALAVEIDTNDPVTLRDAVARDPVLARLRTVAQAAVADRGIRLMMRIDRP